MVFLCIPLCWPVAAVVFVDATRPAGGNGSSWAQAYRALEDAVNSSGTNEAFWVADGVYTPSSTLMVKPGSKIYGGFAGGEGALTDRDIAAHPAIVHGQGNLKHVFFLGAQAENVRLDGLTITAGNARQGSGWDEWGAGVFVDRPSSVTLANCTFSNNSATSHGGGVFLNRATVTMTNCLFVGNSSPFGGALGAHESDLDLIVCRFNCNAAQSGERRGGALWINACPLWLDGCSFLSNNATMGGAVDLNNSSAVLSNCTFVGNASAGGTGLMGGGAIANNLGTLVVDDSLFRGNTTEGDGGGVYSYYTPVIIRGCTFWENSAEHGGGILIDYKLATRDTIERCLFAGNTASVEGGALSSFVRSVDVDNCVFAYNEATSYGGAVRTHAGDPAGPYHDPAYVVRLRNCVVYGSRAGLYGGGMVNSFAPMNYLYNCVFWSNTVDSGQCPDYGNCGSSSISTRYCDIQTLSSPHGSISEDQTGSLSKDPRFIDPDGPDNVAGTLDDDFRLDSSSPCLDRADGNNAPSLDRLFNPRIDLSGVPNLGTGTPDYADIGAYERISQVETPLFSPDGGSYSNPVSVVMSCATAGATIRYTTDGTTPGGSSPAGTHLTLTYTTTLRAQAFKGGMLASDVKSASYTMNDADNDGLPDWVETNTGVYQSPTDTGSDPNDDDSDDDSLNDGEEVDTHLTDPNDDDSDDDGLSDGAEVLAHTTDPNDADSDDDGLKDGEEVTTYLTQPKDADSDDDGLNDGAEVLTHTTDPNDADSDDDGLTDGEEVNTYHTNPKSADSDGDGMPDGWELTHSLDPTDDGTTDPTQGPSGDLDSDTLTNLTEYQKSTNPRNADTDGDGLGDEVETNTGIYVSATDTGSDPTKSDSDGDGRTDGLEVSRGTDPNDVSSFPRSLMDDFDGDAASDIRFYDAGGGYWYILESASNTVRVQQFGWRGPALVPADYDGDGRADLGLYYPPTGTWYVLPSSSGALRADQFGWSGPIPVPSDYDGDGKTDLGLYYPPTGTWYILGSKDGLRVQQFGWSGPTPLPGDYDGDGKADLGLYYPPNGTWYMWGSQDGFWSLQFGWNGPTPVPGDYDGDGKTDCALYYQPTGEWYLLRSTQGFMTGGFGWSAAVPVPGDYDGDGKTDRAVLGPGSTWYILRSSNGVVRTRQFGW
ncbi:MAG: chitobiase/beta-hexosaminidase C-terminal domain-containing protein [Kiritimatiellae bacterium]|nr:chitobiase/beta-hexosaminidase C-terminal domain-containing protein [Kiritimatiellia bacterium]